MTLPHSATLEIAKVEARQETNCGKEAERCFTPRRRPPARLPEPFRIRNASCLKHSMESRPAVRQVAEANLETGTGIVLDDVAVRATTSGMLEDLGYSVLSADTGSAALKIIQANATIDFVLSDVVMPDGMGSNWRDGLVPSVPNCRSC
jgi:hypothetical protein